METLIALIAGTLYGLVIGIIPSAGATTGLVALFGVIHYFVSEPYLGVVFLMAVVADKIESFTLQLTSLYSVGDLITRPIFMTVMLFTVGIFAYSLKRKGSIDYA